MSASALDKHSPSGKIPKGIIIFSVLLILGSVKKLIGLLNFDYYEFMFQQLPSKVILVRYLFSMTLRWLGLAVGIGVLLRRDIFRKMLIVLCVISLCTQYWKHPFYVFRNIAIYMEYQHGLNDLPVGTVMDGTLFPVFTEDTSEHQLVYPRHPWISFVFFIVMDIVFAVMLILYFRQERVKLHFKS